MPAVEEVNLIGKVQDISDALTLANAAEMPFTTMLKKGEQPVNTLVEYPIDKYEDAVVAGVPDGQDAVNFENAQSNRQLLHARLMKWRRNPMVTQMAQATRQHGDGGNKMAQAKAKKTVELKQDMEKTFLGDQDSNAQTSAITGAVCRGMGSWTSSTAQADTATAVPTAYLVPAAQIYSGAIASLNEDALRTVLQTRYETVKSKGDLNAFCGTLVKNQVSDFSRFDVISATKVLARRFDGGTSEIDTMVEIYKGDYGMVKFWIDLFCVNSKAGDIVDMNKVELRSLLNPNYKDLPDLDGGPRGVVSAIATLANLHPQAHCKIRAS